MAMQIDWVNQVKRKPSLDSRDYRFTLTNGVHFTADLSSAGSKTVTIAAGFVWPTGIAGGNTRHYVYISGGTGTGEAVLITGGTATGGGAGTLSFTTANTHTGSYTITSATAGLMEAQWSLPGSGGAIEVASGSYTMYAPFHKRAIPVFVRGAGEDVTTFIVDPSFGLSHTGVFSAPDDLAIYNTAYLTSGGFKDFTVSFTQPDSVTFGDYTAWPPAIYGQKTSRLHIERVKIICAYDAVTIDGYNGPTIRDVKASFVRRGISLSSIVDSSRVENFHAWPFGMTANQNMVMLYGSQAQSFYIGKADDVKITGAATAANFGTFYSQSTGLLTGNPWVEIVSADMDAGGLTMEAGRVHVMGGTIGATQDATYRPSQRSISYTGGELQIEGAWIGSEAANATTSLVDLDFSSSGVATDQGTAYVKFNGCRFDWTKDAHFVRAHTTGANHGSVIFTANRFNNQAAVAVSPSNAVILAEGRVKVILTGNSANDKSTGTGYFFSTDSDMGHTLVGNTLPGWSIEYSAANGTWAVGQNSGLVNPTPIGSTVASDASIEPTGRVFHVSGTSAIGTIQTALTMGSSPAQIHDITMIPDDIFTWNTSSNIAVVGTAVVGKPVRFMYDASTSKWYPSY